MRDRQARHLEVVGPPPTLRELANAAKREHAMVLNVGSEMIGHAIAAGDALLEAKKLVPRGGWEDWLVENLDYSMTTAQTYMRFARHREQLVDAQALTIAGARRLLHGAAQSNVDEDLQHEARRLRKTKRDGRPMAYSDIAERLGVPQPTVWRWCNPEAERRRLAQARQRSMAGRRALKRQERDRAVKKKGGAVADSYAYIRRAALALDEAREDETDPEVKRHISAALDRLYRVEDEIVRASKLS